MSHRVAASAFLLAIGCVAPPDVPLCGTREIFDTLRVDPVERVDLLLVVDGSHSMDVEREHLIPEIPRIARILATGDRNGDGLVDIAPVRSLHVGVVTADLGGATGVAHCGAGDDGQLSLASADLIGCTGAAPPSGIFDFVSATDDPAPFSIGVGCAAVAGVDECGVEQPLESALRALSLSSPRAWTHEGYVPPVFADGSFGHGDGANAGFLRSDSVLAVLVFTNEDDCSVADVGAELGTVDPADEDPTCTGAGGLLPVERFVEGLVGLRAEPSRLVFSVVAGVPSALVDRGDSYETILASPQMQLVADAARPGRLVPSCTRDGSEATPPRRLVQAARALDALGASTSVHSICSDSLLGPVDLILEKTARALVGRCLPGALEVDEEGRVDCEVEVALAPPESERELTHCEQIDGAVRLADEAQGESVHEVCRLPGLSRAEATSGARGWFYDDGDPRLGDASMLADGCDASLDVSRVSFAGSELRIRCRAHSGDLPYCDE